MPGQAGSIDRRHNLYGTRLPEINRRREAWARRAMSDEPYLLDAPRRRAALTSIREICAQKAWTLHAVHVRTNHVHAVISAPCLPERVLQSLKSRISLKLNRIEGDRRRWAKHGSTQYLWNRGDIAAAVRYVICQQGETMEVFEAPA